MKEFIKIIVGVAGTIYTGAYLITAEPGMAFINQFVFYAMVIFIVLMVHGVFKLKEKSDND